MVTYGDWLEVAQQLLIEHGLPGLTLDRLTRRMRLSKGSFYHHFSGMPDLRSALLGRVEHEGTTQFIDAVESLPSDDPQARLHRLLDLVLAEAQEPALQVAVRAWAAQDPQARAVQERIDRTRLDYLLSVRTTTGAVDEQRASDIARLLYLVVVGARHVVPPVPLDEVHRLCELVAGIGDAPRTGTGQG